MEDFVTFEIAKKLKEKGFREYCIAQVELDNTISFNYVFDNNLRTVLKCHNKLEPYVDAPTIYQVLKWLRKEKKLHIELWVTGKRPIEWHHTIHTLNHSGNTQGWSSGEVCDSYEQAALAGIEYVLNNLI